MSDRGNGRATIKYKTPVSRFSKGTANRLSGRGLVEEPPQPVPTDDAPLRMHQKLARRK